MTNETTTAAAVLSLLSAFEAERKAAAERIERLEAEVASLHRMIAMDADRLDSVATDLRGLDARFEEEAAGISRRVDVLEIHEKIRSEFDGPALDKADGLESRLDEIERAAERLDSRIDYLENQNSNDDEAIREIVERILDGATLSISI